MQRSQKRNEVAWEFWLSNQELPVTSARALAEDQLQLHRDSYGELVPAGFHARPRSWFSACFAGYSAAPVSTATAGIVPFCQGREQLRGWEQPPEITRTKQWFRDSAESCISESCGFLLGVTQHSTNSICFDAGLAGKVLFYSAATFRSSATAGQRRFSAKK